jgi:hypothetical protein
MTMNEANDIQPTRSVGNEPSEAPVRRLGMPRGITGIAVLALAAGMMGTGGACIGLPRALRLPEPEPEPTKHDEERLRLAVERRKRRAEKKAENQHRTNAGKRHTAAISDTPTEISRKETK